MIGFKGSGKSSTGNTIINKKEFKYGVGHAKLTETVKACMAPFPNVNFTVIDTPGLEKDSDFTQIKSDIAKLVSTDVTYALVVRIGRISNEEIKLIETLMKRNKKEMFKKTILILTNMKELGNDDNKHANRTFDSWLAESPNLKKIIGDYELQYLQFENVNASQEDKKSYVKNLCTLLEIPFDEAYSEKSLIDKGSLNSNEEEDDGAVILVTKSELRYQFGKSGETFFESLYTKPKNN